MSSTTVTAVGLLIVALAGPASAQVSGGLLPEQAGSTPFQEHFRERFEVHRIESELSTPRMTWWLLTQMAGSHEALSPFSLHDQQLLQSIVDLDPRAIEWQAVTPFITELCALPDDDVRARGRLFNEAEKATVAFDVRVTSLLDTLTPDGVRRVEALLEADNKVWKGFTTDWEALAIDQPSASQLLFRDKCHNFKMKIDRERLLGEPSVSKVVHTTYRREN